LAKNDTVPVVTRRDFLIAASLLPLSGCIHYSQQPMVESGRDDVAYNPFVLIEGGEFVMGSDLKGDHSPAHRIRLDSFAINKYEVTNAQYLKFCNATAHRLPEFWGMPQYRCGPDYPHHPVVGISWQDAVDYAKWSGARLPSEAEWEYAARGGLVGKKFPNGNTISPAEGNYSNSKLGGSVRVGNYKPNGYGLFDMAGNVVEWLFDRYDCDYYAQSPVHNPKGPSKGKFRVIRGGGWHSGPTCNRVFFRNALPANWLDFNVGFRCVKDT
jgi:formylglycine-generating enzyme required for sulfatase activity